jgi:NAD(P)-dependent dehydrogenase (short-subunit alcohol dehydrogenase family)
MVLNGKIILVTEASRGMGREISLLCAKNQADVIINYQLLL